MIFIFLFCFFDSFLFFFAVVVLKCFMELFWYLLFVFFRFICYLLFYFALFRFNYLT